MVAVSVAMAVAEAVAEAVAAVVAVVVAVAVVFGAKNGFLLEVEYRRNDCDSGGTMAVVVTVPGRVLIYF